MCVIAPPKATRRARGVDGARFRIAVLPHSVELHGVDGDQALVDERIAGVDAMPRSPARRR